MEWFQSATRAGALNNRTNEAIGPSSASHTGQDGRAGLPSLNGQKIEGNHIVGMPFS